MADKYYSRTWSTPELREVKDAQDELDLLCGMFQRQNPDNPMVTRKELSEARMEIDRCIRKAGYFVGPTEGNTWRPRESARLDGPKYGQGAFD